MQLKGLELEASMFVNWQFATMRTVSHKLHVHALDRPALNGLWDYMFSQYICYIYICANSV